MKQPGDADHDTHEEKAIRCKVNMHSQCLVVHTLDPVFRAVIYQKLFHVAPHTVLIIFNTVSQIDFPTASTVALVAHLSL